MAMMIYNITKIISIIDTNAFIALGPKVNLCKPSSSIHNAQIKHLNTAAYTFVCLLVCLHYITNYVHIALHGLTAEKNYIQYKIFVKDKNSTK